MTWQAMDIDAVVQIHLNGLGLCFGNPTESSSLSPGQKPLSHGKMKAMPAMAAYESWKPTSLTADGSRVRCMSRDVKSTVPVLLNLPCRRAVSPMNMKRKALTMDGPAPVASV